MAKESIAQLDKAMFEIPTSLKVILEKLPSPEAIQVIEDIGKTAWIVDVNNNNNKASTFEDQIMDKLSKLPNERLAEMIRSIK
jgi:hypothetical protein